MLSKLSIWKPFSKIHEPNSLSAPSISLRLPSTTCWTSSTRKKCRTRTSLKNWTLPWTKWWNCMNRIFIEIQRHLQTRDSSNFEKIAQKSTSSKVHYLPFFQNRSNKGLFDRNSIEIVIFRVSLWLKWSANMILGLFSCFD